MVWFYSKHRGCHLVQHMSRMVWADSSICANLFAMCQVQYEDLALCFRCRHVVDAGAKGPNRLNASQCSFGAQLNFALFILDRFSQPLSNMFPLKTPSKMDLAPWDARWIEMV